MFAPAKTPREIIDRLYREMTDVLKHPAVVEKYTAMSIDPMPMTPQEFDARVAREIAVSLDIVKKAGLKFN
jgi:tripartite-type tricarboxylate transporter receptor subunit TctC